MRRRYLQAFPSAYKEYLRLFDTGQPLYDGYDYVNSLSFLAANHEWMVGSLLVNLSKDAHYDADAPAYLQHATCGFASEHTKTFVSLLKRLPPVQQANLITFSADVENHSAYPAYQLVIKQLKALGRSLSQICSRAHGPRGKTAARLTLLSLKLSKTGDSASMRLPFAFLGVNA